MSKIVEGLEAALHSVQCEHDFEQYRESRVHNGVSAYCPKCKCRYTAWPTTVHYDEIVAARAKK